MTIQEAQQKTDTWIREIGGGYFSELTNLGILMEEVGELSRWMVRVYGDQNMKPTEKELNVKNEMQEEMADVFWIVLCLANQMNIDMTQAFEMTIEKKTNRDRHRHRGE